MAHAHCDRCVLVSCKHSTTDENCRVELCPNACGASLHRCKIEEHILYTCPASSVPCINSCFGCQAVLSRAELGHHLQHCPASVVQCRFSYERTAANQLSTDDLTETLASDLTIDEKCLQADLALAKQDNGLYNIQKESQPLDFALDIHPGVDITDACSKSTGRLHTLPPRTRACIAAKAPYYNYYSSPSQSMRKFFMFPCNEIVRRDNFSSHWQTCHIEVQTNMCSIIERCPLRVYGCKHREMRIMPNPHGASLEYLQEADCIALRLPDNVTSESINTSGVYAQHIQKQQELACYGYGDDMESYDVLSQLPVEVLMKICSSLDSLGLWNLSMVNHYLRRVCFNLVKKQGIVYSSWQKNKDTNKWEEGAKCWSFSRVCEGIKSWSITDTPALCSHVMACPTLHSLANTYEPEPWEVYGIKELHQRGKEEASTWASLVKMRNNLQDSYNLETETS